MRRTSIFSPMVAIRALAASSTVPPPRYAAAFRASISAAPDFSATSATASLNFRKLASLPTKSVSQLISTSTALPLAWAATMRPSAAMRLAFLSALARPDLRSHSIAASRSPLFSTSAFLHSIMPAPDRSRSSFTIWAEILLIGSSPMLGWRDSERPPSRLDLGRADGGQRPPPQRLLGGCAVVARAAAAITTAVTTAFAARGGLARGSLAARTIDLGHRVAFLVQFDEVVGVALGGGRRGGLAFEDRVGGGAGVQLDRADRVVIARDRVIDQFRVVVGVDHGDHRDAELLGFLHGDVFVADVDHEQRVGQTVHVLDAAQRSLQLVALAATGQHFVLDQLLERTVGLGRFQLLQARHGLLDGAEVGQHAAEPARGDERHAGAGCLFGERFTGRTLGADEQDGAALLRQRRQEIHRVGEQRQGLFEIDDVDLAAGAEDVRGHLGVPVTGLVTEMDAGFQHLTHGDLCHGVSLRLSVPLGGTWGLGPPRIPGFDRGSPDESEWARRGTPKAVPIRVWRWFGCCPAEGYNPGSLCMGRPSKRPCRISKTPKL